MPETRQTISYKLAEGLAPVCNTAYSMAIENQ